MKRKIVSIMLVCAMTFGLCACSSSSSSSSDSAGSTASSTSDGELSGEITFVAWGSDNEIKCDEKACEAFMEKYPGTTVTFEALNDDYATTVETRFVGGESPDVIYGHPQTLLNWMREGMLMPITDVYEEHADELQDEELYSTNLYDAYLYDGDYYATPVGADTSVLFYNKDLLDAAGIEYPTSDTTWEEFAEMCTKLTERDSDGIPSVLGVDSVTGLWQYILYSKGGKVLDDMDNPTEVVFDSPEALETLEWINDNYSAENGFSASESDSTYLEGGFSAGQYAFMISGVYDIVYLADIEDFEWDIAPIPQTMKEEGDTPILYAGYAVSAQTENPELAKEFAYFMTTYEAQTIMAETGLITPLRKDVATSDEVLNFDGAPEHHSLRVENIPYGQNIQGQCLCWDEISDVINNSIYQMVNGELTPQETMDQIQTQASELLDAELNSAE